MVERAAAAAGLELKAHPHMLRHACGYALANKGHDTSLPKEEWHRTECPAPAADVPTATVTAAMRTAYPGDRLPFVRRAVGRVRPGAVSRLADGARVIQGTAAALVVPASLALIGATYPEDERAGAIGVWAAAAALTSTVGPVAGGWLTVGSAGKLCSGSQSLCCGCLRPGPY
jgi:hypothetical protein